MQLLLKTIITHSYCIHEYIIISALCFYHFQRNSYKPKNFFTNLIYLTVQKYFEYGFKIF